MQDENESSNLPLIDTIDLEILMHRDVHFGGSFPIMIDYYNQDGVGVMPDFEIEQLEKLYHLEQELGQNLSDLYLSEEAKTVVEEAKELYNQLRATYTESNSESPPLISDLILSEEIEPSKEIEAIVAEGKKLVPALIHLISSTSFYDPLFPGYGRSPIFAAKCLSKIQDTRAIAPLFEAMGEENFFTDEEIIKALCSFGAESKSFLLKVLKNKPFSRDNERAAIALSTLPEDPEIASESLDLLKQDEVLQKPTFASYLIFACSALSTPEEKETFIEISKKTILSKELQKEMEVIIRNWK